MIFLDRRKKFVKQKTAVLSEMMADICAIILIVKPNKKKVLKFSSVLKLLFAKFVDIPIKYP